MQLNIEGEAADTIDHLVRSGRYPSAEDAVAAALRLAAAEARDVARLREAVREADEEGGEVTLEELDEALEAHWAQLEKVQS